MNPHLRLGFSCTFKNAELFFTDILSERYDVIRDDVNPDYLIFGDANFGQDHLKYNPKKVTKIFYTGEPVSPNYWQHDYAISFDFENSLRHYRLPLYSLEMWSIVTDNKFTDDYNYLQGLHSRIDWEKEWDLKSNEFDMTYVQSNSNAQPRNNFLEYAKGYYKVGCGGPQFNNIGYVIPRDRLLKFDFLRKYKANIAFENCMKPGYVTEKLIDSYYSNTLPIFGGNSLITRDFNQNSFVWYTDTDKINTILRDKKEWCYVMSQPKFNYDIPSSYTQWNNFLNWFGEIVREKNLYND